MATGAPPRWGDGTTDPSHLSPDMEITIDAELFDAGLGEGLASFFRQAFAETSPSGSTMPETCCGPGVKALRGSMNRAASRIHENNLREICLQRPISTRRFLSLSSARGPLTPWTAPTC